MKKYLLSFVCVVFLSSALQANLNSGPSYTLAMIKPNAVKEGNTGSIIEKIERNGLQVVAMKMDWLTKERAQRFYSVHKERPFFNDLTSFISSGPVVALILKGENAVERYRQLMGATDPKKAAPGTIRAEFAKSTTSNSVHGSDSAENAAQEIALFFGPEELNVLHIENLSPR